MHFVFLTLVEIFDYNEKNVWHFEMVKTTNADKFFCFQKYNLIDKKKTRWINKEINFSES